MAISLVRRMVLAWATAGTLARAPLAGGVPREVLENVQEADWRPDGSGLAIVRDVGGHYRLEYPAGKTLYETNGWLSHARFSPRGNAIGFIDHPIKGDDIGRIAVVDLVGKKRDLSADYAGGAQGLAWTPTGDEIWYTASAPATNFELHAVRASGGKSRVVARIAGRMTLQDISQDGRVLVSRDIIRPSVMVSTGPESPERDLSWLDWSVPAALSPDGKMLLFSEMGVGGGGGQFSGTYLRKTDGSPGVRIGDGYAQSLSPDGRWALSMVPKAPPELVLWPTGPGEPRVLPREKITLFSQAANWLPDGRQILFSATERGHRTRLYIQDVNAGSPRPISGEGIHTTPGRTISPDGRWVAAQDANRKLLLCPTERGEPRPVPGSEPLEQAAGWTADGRSLYVYRTSEPPPVKVHRVDIVTGQRKLWKQITPADPAGIIDVGRILVSANAGSYAYLLMRDLSDLYLVEGLR